MQKYAEDLEKSGVGYDQGDRWSFNPARDGKSIIPYKVCDCSSSTAAIIRAGGYDLDTRDPIYTGNFYEKAKAAGFEAINVKGKTLSEIVSEYKITDIEKIVYFHPGNHSVLEYGLNDCFENLGVLLPKVKDYILENFSHLTKDYYAPTPC